MAQVKIMGFSHTRNPLLEPNTMNILHSACLFPPIFFQKTKHWNIFELTSKSSFPKIPEVIVYFLFKNNPFKYSG